MKKFYVYFVKNLTTGLKYIGVKYGKNSDPQKFWITYFTSSKSIKLLIEIYGKDDFKYKILKTFNNVYEALKYENYLLSFARKRQDYLNLHTNFIGNLTEEEYINNKEKHRKIASLIGKLTVLKKQGIHAFTKEERRKISIMGGIAAAKVNRLTNSGIFNEKVRKKQHITLKENKISAFYDPQLRKEISSKGGKSGYFSLVYYKKLGLTEEDRRKDQSNRGKIGGKIGGKKSKGSKTYNDGKKEYKYTAKMQENVPFDVYLINNPQFIRGRIKNNTPKMWVNDGIKNFFIDKEKFNDKIHIIGKLGDNRKYATKKYKKNY